MRLNKTSDVKKWSVMSKGMKFEHNWWDKSKLKPVCKNLKSFSHSASSKTRIARSIILSCLSQSASFFAFHILYFLWKTDGENGNITFGLDDITKF